MANTVASGIRNSVALGGAVRATVKNATAHSGIANRRWKMSAISYLLGVVRASRDVSLLRVRRAMFSEPLLAHPTETGGADAARHPHPREDADRDQHDGGANDEEHMVVAAISGV
jgi:hypothetical protein